MMSSSFIHFYSSKQQEMKIQIYEVKKAIENLNLLRGREHFIEGFEGFGGQIFCSLVHIFHGKLFIVLK